MYQLDLKLKKSVGDESTSANRQAVFKYYDTKTKVRVCMPPITEPSAQSLAMNLGQDPPDTTQRSTQPKGGHDAF